MEDFIKVQDIIEINENDKKIQILESIRKTRNDLQQAHTNFEFAEEELIDFYSYQIKAIQSKLNYLTKLAKSQNIENNPLINKAV